jgi:hypothetical protein
MVRSFLAQKTHANHHLTSAEPPTRPREPKTTRNQHPHLFSHSTTAFSSPELAQQGSASPQPFLVVLPAAKAATWPLSTQQPNVPFFLLFQISTTTKRLVSTRIHARRRRQIQNRRSIQANVQSHPRRRPTLPICRG